MGEERRVIPRKRSVQLAMLVLAGATGCASKAGEGTQPGECVDGIDNDENGLLDCADPGCAGSPDCVPQDTAEPEDDTATVPVDTGEASGSIPSDWMTAVTWISVPAGDFVMGALETEEDAADDEYSRTITLTYDYEIATVELTNDLFSQATDTEVEAACGESCPVVGLSWHEAARVTTLLSDAAGLDACYSCTGAGEEAYCVPLGQPMWCSGYRLPTEAEWERAARADALTVYAGSDTVEDVAWVLSNSGGSVQPVASLAPNAWGGYDFSGNGWEWCHDLWAEMPDATLLVDPTGPTTGEYRVIRGGAYDSESPLARAANREPLEPASRWDSAGLRLARTLNP